MESSIERISPVECRIKVEIPWTDVSSRLTDKMRDLRRQARLPGFRAGKVPDKVLEQRFGKGVREELAGELVGDVPDGCDRARDAAADAADCRGELASEGAAVPLSGPLRGSSAISRRTTPASPCVVVRPWLTPRRSKPNLEERRKKFRRASSSARGRKARTDGCGRRVDHRRRGDPWRAACGSQGRSCRHRGDRQRVHPGAERRARGPQALRGGVDQVAAFHAPRRPDSRRASRSRGQA